ncbi:beta-lactamase family protein [Fulvivirga sp. M361]|uniref:serine hydrolase domain-containing protein n=1 Tax=Fulvivirga sp. M361 TaxID=2594266 RepID=UPI00117A64ED|nr:serine hydrolase domain-containing protein [Fulvivirga sp. M361]TRX57588.1 beta-lactamase family protein [Fulvivirga sp. M361]
MAIVKKRNIFLYGLAATFIIILSFIFLSSDEVNEAELFSIEKPVIPVISPISNPIYSDFIASFEQKLTLEFEQSGIPGAAVGVLIDGTIVTLKGLGLLSTNQTDSVNVHTTFRIASVSKGFASVLAGLHTKEKLNWNDPVKIHLPDFQAEPTVYTDSITIKHILSHSAGYPYQAFSTLVEDGMARDVMLSELQGIELSRKPGEIHSYQNVAYSLIEPVLENLTHCSYSSLLHERIFTPLNMADASISYDDMWYNTNAALPHRRSISGYKPVGLSRSYYNVAAAGGINASISDMAQWMQALMGLKSEVIPLNVLDSVFKPVIRTSVKNASFSSFDHPRKGHYGMGWRIVEYPQDTLIYHGGYANGYKSEIALDRQKGIAICILTNSPGRFSNRMVVEFFQSFKEHFPETADEPDNTILTPATPGDA